MYGNKTTFCSISRLLFVVNLFDSKFDCDHTRILQTSFQQNDFHNGLQLFSDGYLQHSIVD